MDVVRPCQAEDCRLAKWKEHDVVRDFDPNDLLRADAYPWQPDEVQLIETHISWVFLAGDKVVKVKRPLKLDFVDHTTLEKRRFSCEEEVRLNRRLTEEVYFDAVPITTAPGGLEVQGDGPVIEWATLMRRMPAEGMLDVVLAEGRAPVNLGEIIAGRLIPFHADTSLPCEGDPDRITAMVLDVVTDNLDELDHHPLAPVQLGLIQRSMREFIERERPRLLERTRGGWVRDGHGDLRCDHICIEPNGVIQVFDCVEFNADLRRADVASDLAFLLMDLHRLGAGEAANDLVRRYREAGFDLPDDVLRLYWAHRALVRAKVAQIRDSQSGGDGASEYAEEALAYMQQASARVLTVSPAVICVSGLSGTGKSTLGRALAAALGVEIISSDMVRKELAGIEATSRTGAEAGIYSSEWTERTYAEMRGRGGKALDDARPVLLDATFLDSGQRERAAELARERGVPFVLLETVTDEDVVLQRLEARSAQGDAVSDAGKAIYRQQRARYETSPPVVPDGAVHIVVDTTATDNAVLDPVLAELDRQGVIRAEIPTQRM
jgi:aminoglycoside phosphotransferase family enzyme/predicted kinase